MYCCLIPVSRSLHNGVSGRNTCKINCKQNLIQMVSKFAKLLTIIQCSDQQIFLPNGKHLWTCNVLKGVNPTKVLRNIGIAHKTCQFWNGQLCQFSLTIYFSLEVSSFKYIWSYLTISWNQINPWNNIEVCEWYVGFQTIWPWLITLTLPLIILAKIHNSWKKKNQTQ